MIDRSLPLIDLHRHLDGNIRPQTILTLGRRHNIALPADELAMLRPHVQIVDNEPNLLKFLEKLNWGVAVLADYDACWQVAYENVEDLKRAGIDYGELRFSPVYMAMAHGLHPEGVVEAVIDGVSRASCDLKVKTNLIGIMSRTFGRDSCYQELAACLAYRDQLVAIDLAGDEIGFPADLFVDHFNKARDAGMRTIAHAGEAGGPESVWQAINLLGAERIGHGTHSINDPTLVEYLAKHRIGVESCLTSNLQTSAVPSLCQHPIRRFLAAGVIASLNSDDPGVQGVDLPHEYEVAAPAAGMTADEIRTAQQNGLTLAFLSDQEKKALMQVAAQRAP